MGKKYIFLDLDCTLFSSQEDLKDLSVSQKSHLSDEPFEMSVGFNTNLNQDALRDFNFLYQKIHQDFLIKILRYSRLGKVEFRVLTSAPYPIESIRLMLAMNLGILSIFPEQEPIINSQSYGGPVKLLGMLEHELVGDGKPFNSEEDLADLSGIRIKVDKFAIINHLLVHQLGLNPQGRDVILIDDTPRQRQGALNFGYQAIDPTAPDYPAALARVLKEINTPIATA